MARPSTEEKVIGEMRNDGWRYFEDPPIWLRKQVRRDGTHRGGCNRRNAAEYSGSNYRYKVVPGLSNNEFLVFSKPKGDGEIEEQGYCHNCDQHITQGSDDPFLYCYDCGYSTADYADGEVGACPNCYQYISRDEDDTFLHCYDCGWTIGVPLFRHLIWRR